MVNYAKKARQAVDAFIQSGDIKAYTTARKTIQRAYQRAKKANKPTSEIKELNRAVSYMQSPDKAVKQLARITMNRLKAQVKNYAEIGNREKVRVAKENVTVYRNTLSGLDRATSAAYAVDELDKITPKRTMAEDDAKLLSDMRNDGLTGTDKELRLLNDKAKEAIKALSARYATFSGFNVGHIGNDLTGAQFTFADRMNESFNILNQIKKKYGYKSNEAKEAFDMLAKNKTTYTHNNADGTRTSYATVKYTALAGLRDLAEKLLK